MLDLKNLRDDDLVRRGRIALRAGKFGVANELFAEYCDRHIREEQPISGTLLADYALTVAHLGDPKEAAEICFGALAHERRNADIFAALARIYALSGSRKKAVDTIERGLAISPRHPGLLAFREELGVRRPPLIPFLARDNRWNVWLGRVFEKLGARGGVA